MISYQSTMMSEYGMSRDEALWRLPFAVGVAMITATNETGQDEEQRDEYDGIETLVDARIKQYGTSAT